jgi:hypothetical protein
LLQDLRVNTVLLREPGQLFNELPGDRVSNFYNVRFFNKTFTSAEVELVLISPDGEIQWLGDLEPIPGQQQIEKRFMVFLSKDNLAGSQTGVEFAVLKDGKQIQTVTSNFLGPEAIR